MEAVYLVLVPFALGLILIALSPAGRRTPVLQALRWRTGIAVVGIGLLGAWILGMIMVELIAD